MALSIETHFKELKYRILYISFSWLITFFFSYLNVTYIIYILTLPFLQIKKVNTNLNQSDFIFTNIFEAFSSYVLVSFVTTIYLLLPVISYSCFAFLKSGLMKHEQKYTIFMIKLFLLCCSLALLFTHQIFLPFILNFFLSFEELVKTNLFTLKLEPKILDYLCMIINSFFLFTLIFQIPFSLFLLLNQNLINVYFLEKNRKSFLIISVIAGGVLTPPDICTQLIIALPLCLFFEFILLLSYMKKLYEKLN
uniref:TatC n=1 Tax=Chroomonas placoidea TaxID=173977 RepID=A0A2P1G828_9CRYP|nr:TatC [Chroomonas placoidea]AVM81117.1 TatC [Chroomonas placoidea]